jgi:nucleoside-diphosphate-sugar epimerase
VRTEVKDTVLLTGATGALGSMLLPRLDHEGYDVVCLVRGKDPDEARARVNALLRGRGAVRRDIIVVRGDITEPQCGISDADRRSLVGRIGRVFHSAASINLQSKDDTQLTNVAGLAHVLELTETLGVPHFVHVSTAYVIGDAPYLSEEDAFLGQRWNNHYEETKFVGENMVRAWARKQSGRSFTIFRPSILVGCEDGSTSTLDGFYSLAESFHRVAESLRSRNGKSLPADVLISAQGRVRVPLAVLMGDQRANCVPIDWAAEMMVAALDLPPRNETFHFVHHEPLRVRDCLAWSLDHLKIDGVAICDTLDEKDRVVRRQTPFVRRLQRRFDVVHDLYVPYLTTEPRFQMEAARRGLGAKFRSPPTIDQAYILRLLKFAGEKYWGPPEPARRRLFDRRPGVTIAAPIAARIIQDEH